MLPEILITLRVRLFDVSASFPPPKWFQRIAPSAQESDSSQFVDALLSPFTEKHAMNGDINHLDQRIGFAVPNWTPRPHPPRTSMEGRFCRVVPLDVEQHAMDLYRANSEDSEGRMWTYLAYGPFATFQDYLGQMNKWLAEDWHIHAIVDPNTGRAEGLASYMRVEPEAGSIEVGAIMYAPRLQRTAAGTEAMYLMMTRVFDELGYRRYEWRCNALNKRSISAAKRLGFRFEGIFLQAAVLKGRNRDTAWFSITDREWPSLKKAFESWLAPDNFDSGRQIRALREFMCRDDCGL